MATVFQTRASEIAAAYPSAIVLMQYGDFCEVHGPAAHDAAKVLGMIVTQARRIGEEPTPMMGFPKRCRSMYVRQLVEAGRTVVFVKQLPKTQGGGWEVESITTPGTSAT